jgi:hypothetical protein
MVSAISAKYQGWLFVLLCFLKKLKPHLIAIGPVTNDLNAKETVRLMINPVLNMSFDMTELKRKWDSIASPIGWVKNIEKRKKKGKRKRKN